MAWNSALVTSGHRTATRLIGLVVAGWLSTAGTAAATTNAPLRTLPELIAKLASQANQPHLRQAALGVKIVALDSGRTIFEQDASRLRKPASNNKLFTGALALDRFGPDFRIRTSVYAASVPDPDGVVAGDVVVYGRGDFSMSARFNNGDYSKALAPMVDAFARAGVKRITGSLVGDDSFFRTPPYGNSWTTDDLQYYYGAEVSALSLQDNVVDVVVKAGAKPGDPVRLSLKPETSYLAFSNRAATVAKGDKGAVEFYRPLGRNIVYVQGSLPVGGSTSDAVTLSDPALFFATQLRAALAARGITVDQPPKSIGRLDRDVAPLDPAWKEIAFAESRPMSELVYFMMKPSQNLYAQLLLLQAGRRTKAEDSPLVTTETLGLRDMGKFLGCIGVNPSDMHLEEGSGLSRSALITPDAVVTLLRHMAKHPQAKPFFDSLPLGGVDGTLRSRFLGTAAERNVSAKTGVLAYVASLSGIVTTASKERVAFSLLLNNYTGGAGKPSGREIIDGIAVTLADYTGKLE